MVSDVSVHYPFISYDNLPPNIKEVVDSYDEEGDTYKECRRIQEQLDSMGWSCDYYLDGVLFDFKKKH